MQEQEEVAVVVPPSNEWKLALSAYSVQLITAQEEWAKRPEFPEGYGVLGRLL